MQLLVIDTPAVAIFAFTKAVAWPQALLMMVGTAVGGYSSVYYAGQLKPRQWVHPIFVNL